MQVSSEKITANSEMPLQLLLFVDRRPTSREQIQKIRSCLYALEAEYAFELQVVDVGKQPYLAEHFKLVATPALIKIHPEPRQTLAGSNLVAQIEKWWPRWQRMVAEYVANLQSQSAALGTNVPPNTLSSIAYSAELIRLSDEVFRLEQEKESLEEQLQFKDRLIAMLAHDLRSPLTATSIALETLEMGQNRKNGYSDRFTPELAAQLLKQARSQTRALDRMITEILQATATEFRMQFQKLDLGVLCQEVLEEFSYRFQQKAQQVETDIPSDLACVYADRERLRQVIANLLGNAIKYNPPGGKIEVSMLHRTTQKIQVSICDNGPGVPDENRDRIFEDRFRLKRDEAKDGYGIGLALCQRIVRAHYGRIWVDSELGHGSCFHFTLPVYSR